MIVWQSVVFVRRTRLCCTSVKLLDLHGHFVFMLALAVCCLIVMMMIITKTTIIVLIITILKVT